MRAVGVNNRRHNAHIAGNDNCGNAYQRRKRHLFVVIVNVSQQ